MKKWLYNPRVWLAVLGIIAAGLGIAGGDISRVMVNGASVCLDCMGLG